MTIKSFLGVAMLFVVALSGMDCQSTAYAPHETQVTHVVIAWLKQPGDQVARQRIIDAAKRRLSTIPGVVMVTAGTAIRSTRPVVDSSYDVALVITFHSVDDLNRYPTHPTHQQMVAELIKPLVARYIIYDVLDSGR